MRSPVPSVTQSTRRAAETKLDDAISQVEGAGGTLVERGEHAPGAPFAYVRDPDGYLIEL